MSSSSSSSNVNINPTTTVRSDSQGGGNPNNNNDHNNNDKDATSGSNNNINNNNSTNNNNNSGSSSTIVPSNPMTDNPTLTKSNQAPIIKSDNNTNDTATTTTATTTPTTTTTSNPNNETILLKVGYIVEEYKCSHNNFQGILYVGPLAVVFLGRMLLFEWTVVIPWEDVNKVAKDATRVDGIRIDTRQGANRNNKYIFERFFDVSRVLGVLISLHNDSILDLTPTTVVPPPPPKVLSRGLRRNNSDPLRISNIFNFDDDALVYQTNETLQSLARDREQSKSQTPVDDKTDLSRVSTLSVPTPTNFQRSATYNFSSDSNRVLLPQGSDQKDINQDDNLIQNKKNVTQTIQEEWQAVLHDSCQSYSEMVIQNMKLDCDLDTFYNQFLADDAEYSMATFMAKNGDQDIQISPWITNSDHDENDPTLQQQQQQEQQQEKQQYTRTIEYTHPVDAPMAPPMARAKKDQSYRRYGDYGLVFATKTHVADVPLTDCFYVADMIRVEAVVGPTTNTNTTTETTITTATTSVLISMHFDVRFVKSTMFRTIISRTTKSELERFCHSLAEFMSQSVRFTQTTSVLGDTVLLDNIDNNKEEIWSAAAAVLPSTSNTKVEPSTHTNRWIHVGVILVAWIASTQWWMAWEIRQLRIELQHMASVVSVQSPDNRNYRMVLIDETMTTTPPYRADDS
jgi:hypothetical protein